MRWLVVALALSVLGLVRADAQMPARGRVALVIANAQYTSHPALSTPKADAELVGGALRRAGFDSVTVVQDLSGNQFRRTLADFAGRADGAEIAFIYYAGHGLEVGGRNWLIPVDARLSAERDVEFEAVTLDAAISAMSGARTRILALDASRDNPFARNMREVTRAIGGGLAPVSEDDLLVMYSTSPGMAAADGERNSPFAVALARRLVEPNVDVRILASLVRDDVISATAGRQRPFVSASLRGEAVYLVKGSAGRPSAPQSPVANQPPAAPRFTFSAQPRLALVIGAGDYNKDGDLLDVDPLIVGPTGYMTDLPNALNDANDVHATLTQLRFDVTLIRNPEQGELADAVVEFARKVRRSGPNAIALVFYSGHGFQTNGVNFIVPAKAKLPDGDLSDRTPLEMESTLRPRAYVLNDLLGLLPEPGVSEGSGAGVNVIVLDACRNNPWDGRVRGVGRGGGAVRGSGLVATDLPQRLTGTLVVFSTSSGDYARDGVGSNSPYTTALKARLPQENTSVLNLFNAIQRDVRVSTKGGQIPSTNNLGGVEDVCIGACVAAN